MKTSDAATRRGFESHSLRHTEKRHGNKNRGVFCNFFGPMQASTLREAANLSSRNGIWFTMAAFWKGFSDTCLFFPEHQQLASHIIEYHHQHLGNELPDIAVAMEQVHGDEQNGGLKQAGGQTGGNEFAQLRQDHLHGPVVALEDEGLVGHKGKNHRHHPGNAVAHRGGQVQPIQAGQINKIIDHRGQHAEDQIGHHIYMFLYEGNQFFFHCTLSPLFFPYYSIILRKRNQKEWRFAKVYEICPPEADYFRAFLKNHPRTCFPIDISHLFHYYYIDK